MADTYGAASALAEIEAELGQVMTFNGSDYPCVAGASTTKRTAEIGGFSVEYDFEVAIRTEPFTVAQIAAPDAQDLITVNGRAYRVLSVAASPCGNVKTLLCQDANRGA